MYLSHFHLEKEPLKISPDPAFLWLSEKPAKAFVSLKEGILKCDGCVLLTGDIGTGKSTLIKRRVKFDDMARNRVALSGKSEDVSSGDRFAQGCGSGRSSPSRRLEILWDSILIAIFLHGRMFLWQGAFRLAPRFDPKDLRAIFEHRVLKMLLSQGKITRDLISLLRRWLR